jgi:dinuclear metal center YbgI/SA1388 family protein
MPSLSPTQLLDILETLAPLSGSAEWDNTGLLIEGNPKADIQKILLTLDLTPAVADEAIRLKADWILSYHPPIFSGLKQLTHKSAATSAFLKLIQAGISVYSPHTALDAALDGVSDWLASFFPEAAVEMVEGSGRRLTFTKGLSFKEVSQRFQQGLNLPYLRVAAPKGHSKKIRSIGLCPGAGASVLADLHVDAVFTGEMRYHDILTWQVAGTYVFLAEHGLSERPYLKILQYRLSEKLPDSVKVLRSKQDREPLSLILPHA